MWSKMICKISLATMLTVAIGTVWADVTIEQLVKVEAGGAMAMLSSEGTVTTMISGNRARMDNDIESKSAMMQKFGGNLSGSAIVLVDEELMLNLSPEKEQYSETTFAQLREQNKKAMENLEEMQDAQGSGLPVDESECQWSEPEVSVNHTKEKQRFGGVKAEQHLITASQTCTVPETGKSCKISWNLDYWVAKRLPGDDEAAAFQENFAKALGGDEMLAMAKANYRGLLNMFKRGWEDVLSESEQMEGYPARTVMSMEMGGEQCTMPSGESIAMDDIWGNAADVAIDSAAGTAAYHAGSAAGQAAGEAIGGGVGGSIAGSAVGAASREMASGLMKKFGRKKSDQEEQPAEAQQANQADAPVTLFRITSELTFVSKDAVPAGKFEVPADWKKVSAPGI
jgi:hypothetical protein